MIDVEQAMNVLRLDSGDIATEEIVESLLYAVPSYIEAATGLTATEQENDIYSDLIDTVTGFILRLWYYPEHTDSEKLQRVIDSLLKSITVLSR